MQPVVVVSLGIIFPWGTIMILVFQISFTGSYPVTKHFRYIAKGHFDPFHGFSIAGIVNPIFHMMFIASLMVEPGSAIPFLRPFCFIGTAVALVIFDSRKKFHKRIF